MSTLTTEEKLDEALKQTFPASDAFSLTPADEQGAKPIEPRPEKKAAASAF